MPRYVNQLARPQYVELKIVDQEERAVGTLRVKPSSILWKPKNAQQFYAVPLDAFAGWITSAASGHTKTTK